ncbi:MAG: RagB/SusD family nutrient uptake outer membrane protein [Janthinobacterium sp.]|jgi:hypothetical protein
MLIKNIVRILILLVTLGQLGCKKGFLEEKPEKALDVPTSISDYQAILDNPTSSSPTEGRVALNYEQPALVEISSDDFYVVDNAFIIGSLAERNAYRWSKNIFENIDQEVEWNTPYRRIYYSNIVIEGIKKVKIQDSKDVIPWNNVLGGALFFRAYNHFVIAQQFCKPYDRGHSGTDLGIPLRLTANFNERSMRPSVEETYKQILADLRQSSIILPITTPINPLYTLRPTKTAALAMLARVYLSMSEYDSAYVYADKALHLYSELEHFKNFDPSQLFNPIPEFNKEVILMQAMNNYALLHPIRAMNIDSIFYKQYDNHDLRKNIYFADFGGRKIFKGSYWGFVLPFFSGLATDELYLIRAECMARKGNVNAAMDDLNMLLVKR